MVRIEARRVPCERQLEGRRAKKEPGKPDNQEEKYRGDRELLRSPPLRRERGCFLARSQ
jgi:hypothetical protein